MYLKDTNSEIYSTNIITFRQLGNLRRVILPVLFKKIAYGGFAKHLICVIRLAVQKNNLSAAALVAECT